MSKDPHQLVNLAEDPAYKEALQRHRDLLDEWLSRGDEGAGEESAAALRHNGDDWKGGRGVNPEYEINRPDNDGDGLSDKWEKINGRDPSDGRLYYEFDCGGWQTEGWVGSSTDNIAGYLGYLDFRLQEKTASLKRSGLNVTATDDDESLLIRLRSSGDLTIQAKVNGTALGQPVRLVADKDYRDVRIPLKNAAAWKGSVKSLQLDFYGVKGDSGWIDSIQIAR